MGIEDAISGEMLARRPSVAWKYIAQIEESCRGKGPNAGHKAIQRLATSGQFEVWILTQNVDGFHTAAGSENVIEIHGNVHGLQCTHCSYEENVTTYEGLSYNRIGSFDESIFPRCCTEIPDAQCQQMLDNTRAVVSPFDAFEVCPWRPAHV